METLHTVMRSIRGETHSRRNHLSVFREFLDHLERIGRNRDKSSRDPRTKSSGERKNVRRNGK